MPRTRAQIRADIAALQQELKAAPPDSVKVVAATSGTFEFARGLIYFMDTAVSVCRAVNNTQYYDLRDWLNHHYPADES